MSVPVKAPSIINSRTTGIFVLGLVVVHAFTLFVISNEFQRAVISNFLSVAESATAAICAFYASRKLAKNNARQSADAWTYIAYAMLVYAIGDAVFFGLDSFLQVETFPSLADVFYISFYVLFVIGLIRLPTRAMRGDELRKLILDLGVIVVGSLMVFWVFLYAPILVAAQNMSGLSVLLSLLYPTLDLAILWAATSLLIRQRELTSPAPTLLLCVGVILMALADALFNYSALVGESSGGNLPDILFGFSWLAMTFAAVYQMRITQTEAQAAYAREQGTQPTPVLALFSKLSEGPIYTYLPYVWVWLSYTMLLILQVSTQPNSNQLTPFNVAVIGVGIIILLVTVRQVVAFRENERLSTSLTRLLEASRILSSPLELRAILNLILNELKHIVEFDNAAVLLLQPQSRDTALAIRYGTPSSNNDPATTVPLAPEHKAVLRSGKAMVNNGKGVEETSWMGVPLMAQDKAIGLISVQCYRANYYTNKHTEVSLAFANQAAAAIENARLRNREAEAATTAERRRLARELHDSVSQALFGIALGARTMQQVIKQDVSRAAETTEYILKLTEGALAEMRALIYELRPESLATEGLLLALQKQTTWLCTRHNLDAAFVFDCEEPNVPVEMKEALYRIAVEGIQNTIKHAHASKVEVRFAFSNKMLTLDIKDNGVGFDPDKNYDGHFGLIGMRERAANFGGSVNILSSTGKGSVVMVRMPMPSAPTLQPNLFASDGSANEHRANSKSDSTSRAANAEQVSVS